MKISTKLLMLLTLVCLFSSAATAQKKPVRKTQKAVCKVAPVPHGMVIVGYKRGACPVAIVKLAEAGDSICADSPVPDGFTIFAQSMGAKASSCPSTTFVIYGQGPPNPIFATDLPNSVRDSLLQSKCYQQADREIAMSLAKGIPEDRAIALAIGNRYTCMKQGEQ